MPIPFRGLTPAGGREHATWVVDAMAGREGVDLVVPQGFDAYARVHHRIHNGERWADLAPEYLTRGLEMYEYPGSTLEFIDGDGNLDAADVDALVPMLAAETVTPDRCHYALWDGWGWVHRGDHRVVSGAGLRWRGIRGAGARRRDASGVDVCRRLPGRAVVGRPGHDPVRRPCRGRRHDRPRDAVSDVDRAAVPALASPQWESVAIEATDRW